MIRLMCTRYIPSLLSKIRELLKKEESGEPTKDPCPEEHYHSQELYPELIRNAIRNGSEAVGSVIKNLNKRHEAEYDLIIIGADPAGIAASLAARQNRLKFLLLEQETIRKSMDAFSWQRNRIKLKVAMPMAGEITISKDTWQDLLTYYRIPFEENCRIRVEQRNGLFRLHISDSRIFTSASLIYATGINGKLCEIGLSKNPEPVLRASARELSYRSN